MAHEPSAWWDDIPGAHNVGSLLPVLKLLSPTISHSELPGGEVPFFGMNHRMTVSNNDPRQKTRASAPGISPGRYLKPVSANVTQFQLFGRENARWSRLTALTRRSRSQFEPAGLRR